MAQETIEFGSAGIRRALKHYTPSKAIAEFVWNGFDANASKVSIDTETQIEALEFGAFSSLSITDDGLGISSASKFKPFFHKISVIDPDIIHQGPSAKHGKNGIGRLTFFTFAAKAEWDTVCSSKDNQSWKYKIKVDAEHLNKFDPTSSVQCNGTTGTKVTFTGIWELDRDDFIEVTDFLVREFAWFLELASPFSREILIDGEKLTYDKFIADRDERTFEVNGINFQIKYVRWQGSLNREYSRYYFIGSDNKERIKKSTTFNNKGDNFYHSVYVRSSYFDPLQEGQTFPDSDTDDGPQGNLFIGIERDETFRELQKKLDEYLRSKRRPFLRKKAKSFILELEKDNVFPFFGPESWEQIRKQELSEVVIELYEADPRIFSNLNTQQKQTLLSLFSLVMDSTERDHLLDIVGQVVNLDSKERKHLANTLQRTRLTNVIATLKLIEDRFTAVDELKKMVFKPDFYANEREHLQAQIEQHFWLFGEQYHLVTAAEPDFEEALSRHQYMLKGEKKFRKIKHPDKNKEMDIFAVRRLHQIDQINNVVIELKHPEKTLGETELAQVKTYMNVTLSEPEFNGKNMTWEFYLVGNKYNDYIEREMEHAKNHGEKHLVFKLTNPNYKIYVLTWSEIFVNFDLRHKFLDEKLKLEREKLATSAKSADDLLVNAFENTAAYKESLRPLTQPQHAS